MFVYRYYINVYSRLLYDYYWTEVQIFWFLSQTGNNFGPEMLNFFFTQFAKNGSTFHDLRLFILFMICQFYV